MFKALFSWFASLAGTPSQSIECLSEEDLQRLHDQRCIVDACFKIENIKLIDQTGEDKLGAIQSILESEIFVSSQTYELQCLGIVLGDAFVQELEMEWVMVEDRYGRDPAVRMPNSSILVFPLTMISKRIEQNKNVDVFEMFNGLSSKVDELKRQGV